MRRDSRSFPYMLRLRMPAGTTLLEDPCVLGRRRTVAVYNACGRRKLQLQAISFGHESYSRRSRMDTFVN